MCECFRLVEEVREKCGGIRLQNNDVYLATTLNEFVRAVILMARGGGIEEVKYDTVSQFHIHTIHFLGEILVPVSDLMCTPLCL